MQGGWDLNGLLHNALELLHTSKKLLADLVARSFFANNGDNISVLILSSREDHAHGCGLLQLVDKRTLGANDKAVELLLNGHID